jgi:methionyl-tRNA formyltransferase
MMVNSSEWWTKPREVLVVVDNDSWILPYAAQLVKLIKDAGDIAQLLRSYDYEGNSDVAFLLGCTTIAPSRFLSLNRKNLVVHESSLPQGRGFSPLTWQILEGKNSIPISLIEASEEVDAGKIVGSDIIEFEGHELNDELKAKQAAATLGLCLKYLSSENVPDGTFQEGPASYYGRRYPRHSELDISKSIEAQFNHLRVVDNQRYPAFFEFQGYRYKLLIEKIGRSESENKE